MILCADIGNTNVSLGIFHEKKLYLSFDLPVSSLGNKEKILRILSKNFKKHHIMKKDIKQTIICSVVPKASSVFKHILKQDFGIKSFEVGRDIKVPIKNCYFKPEQTGQDRLVNAFAGVVLYGKPLVVIDFGTCITFDCVSKKGDYLGGLIMPGIDMILNALHEKTALLPKIKMSPPGRLIGCSTEEGIKSGVFFGFVGACEAIIKKLKDALGKNTRIIATGGNMNYFSSLNKSVTFFNSDLTLQGLFLIFKEKTKK